MAFDKLIWEDHFDGDTIDRDKWSFEIGFIRNHEPQYYTDRPCNAYVEDSMLHIVTLREDYEGAKYTSASLNTEHKFSCTYGRIEMRAKLPWSKSLWPAFWTLGENISVIDWPHCGEIDIMESTVNSNPDSNGEMRCTLHFQTKSTDEHNCITGDYKLPSGEKLADDFHIYAVEWEEKECRFYFDDQCIVTHAITEDMKQCFHRPHFILINTALSDWNDDERPNDVDTVLPQHYIIDYIRVYQ